MRYVQPFHGWLCGTLREMWVDRRLSRQVQGLEGLFFCVFQTCVVCFTIRWRNFLSIHLLSIDLSIYPSIYHLSFFLFACLCVDLSIDESMYLSIGLSIHLSISLFVYVSVVLSMHLSFYVCIYLYIYMYTYRSTHVLTLYFVCQTNRTACSTALTILESPTQLCGSIGPALRASMFPPTGISVGYTAHTPWCSWCGSGRGVAAGKISSCRRTS